MKYLQQNEDFETMLATHPVLIVNYGVETCGTCHALAHRVDAWLEKHPKAQGVYVDIAAHPAIGAQRQILSAPTVQVYLNGTCVIEKAGYFSMDEVLAKTAHLMALAFEEG